MQAIAPSSWDYGYGLEYYDIDGDNYYGHSGDVGNTSGLFFSDISTPTFPAGYYVAYNYTYEGVAPYNVLDKPLHDMMQSFVPGSIAVLGQMEIEVNMFPNPASDRITMVSDGILSVRILDVSGRVVKELTTDTDKLYLELQDVDSGIYLVSVMTENGMAQKKLVVR